MKKIMMLFMVALFVLSLAGTVSAQAAANECAPVDVVLVMDRSGSMGASHKLDNAKTAGKFFVDLLETDDYSALTYFSSTATRDVTLTNNKNTVKAGIDALTFDTGQFTQSTCLKCGVNEGQAELNANSRTNVVKAMILLTDGKPTVHSDNATASEAAAAVAKGAGTLLFTIGVGDVNDTLLTNMASKPSYYYYDADSTDLNNIYQEIAGELCNPFCGDGIVDTNEECDDGNNANGDGCSASCTTEITDPICGNGIKEGGEECDDGNNANGDGCSSQCVLETFCGDGVLDETEQCDDGNTNNGDGCSAECIIEQTNDVPEFGIIAALGILTLAGIYIYKKRN